MSCIRLKSGKGFTLVELMVALFLASLAVYGIFRTYLSFSISYDVQDQITELQQNLRIGMSKMISDIRMAGFDPLDTGLFGIDAASTATKISFTMDLDESGTFDNDSELFVYSNDSADGELTLNSQPVISNLEKLQFLYLDAANTPVAPQLASTVLISLVVKTSNEDYSYTDTDSYQNLFGDIIFVPPANDHFRRRVLSTLVQCRNIGL